MTVKELRDLIVAADDSLPVKFCLDDKWLELVTVDGKTIFDVRSNGEIIAVTFVLTK